MNGKIFLAQSFSQKMRRLLDSQFLKRPIWFQLFSPVFLFISFMWAFYAFVRRFLGYSTRESPPGIKIVCVGNVIVGGVGKSPFVRALARDALRQGKCVAIVARGVGKKTKNPLVYEVKANDGEFNATQFYSELSDFADEMREHAHLLRSELNPENTARLFVVQNSNRFEAVSEFAKCIGINAKALCLLDDGLQHFSCPRTLNLCVWDVELLKNSPSFSMPFGPYREGFFKVTGPFKMRSLLNAFDLRVWSRTQIDNTLQFKENIQSALSLYGEVPSDSKDLILIQKLSLRSVAIDQKSQKSQNCLILSDSILEVPNSILEASNFRWNLVAGVAQPGKVLQEIQSQFQNFQHCEFNVFALDDHGNLTQSDAAQIDLQIPCLLTGKDFFRWHDQGVFVQLAHRGLLFVCLLEIEVQAWNILHSNQRKEFIIDNK